MAGKYEQLVDVHDDVVDTPEAQLEFQNFVLSSAEQNLTSGRVSPVRQPQQQHTPAADYGFSAPQPQPTVPVNRGAFWTVEYYAQFFDVDSSDVGQRMLASILPKSDFLQVIGEKPDLYGPFWIATSVIFALFITSSVAGSIAAYINSKSYKYEDSLTGLSTAVAVIYIYAAAFPAVVWGLGRYFSYSIGLLQLFDVFGYALTIWIPVSLLCIVPLEIVRWILVIGAFGLSTFFQLKTLRPIISQVQDKRAPTVVYGLAVATTAGLALTFKFLFFNFVFDTTSTST
ncbi:hypothetical protein HK097_003354 [Rhizophlyctis rosea]|uniref:Protein YIP n=1 Tax=Rhizophlyctis rosea TaxID=64517 RepID=A0AAD5SFM4_9FUNG|nr:hypothetical protein HK097_003354 [Rhizophlyctis rosea]